MLSSVFRFQILPASANTAPSSFQNMGKRNSRSASRRMSPIWLGMTKAVLGLEPPGPRVRACQARIELAPPQKNCSSKGIQVEFPYGRQIPPVILLARANWSISPKRQV